MRRTTLVMAGLLGLLLGLLPATGAQASTHTITGRITVPAGFDVQLVSVNLYAQNDWVAGTAPDASGDYSFSGIPDGTYSVRASGNGLSEETTGPFAVSTSVRGKNLSLSELFTVSGQVARDGNPITAGWVYFFASCADVPISPRASGQVTASNYSVEVPAGTYRVLITAEIESWHSAKVDCSDATVVEVTGDTALGLTALPPARIKGTVSYKGSPVSGVFVSARRWDGSAWKPVAFAQSADDGKYTIADLLPGTYRIRFDSAQYGSKRLPGHYWEGTQTLESATDIVVAAGATVQGIDALMLEGARVSGTVTGPAGPRQGALVTIYGGDGSAIVGVVTEPDGTWEYSGLWPGTYTLGFQDAEGHREFWNDKPEGSADSFTLANLEHRTGLDAWLGGPDPCEFQKNCPAPPPVGQSLKAPPKTLKRGKRARLAATTAQGGKVSWRTTTKKRCRITQNKVRGLKKGKCVLRASSPASAGFTELQQRYTIRIR